MMTRDLSHFYTSHPAPGQSPYDLPPENYRLTIGNVDAAHAVVSLTDPLTGTSQPASIVSRSGDQIVVQLQATDSPRMLTIDDSASNPVDGTNAPPVELSAPKSVPTTTALGPGITATVRCAQTCWVIVSAASAHGGTAKAHVVKRVVVRAKAGKRVKVRLKPGRSGRNWLVTRRIGRIKITARVRTTTASRTVKLSKPRHRARRR